MPDEDQQGQEGRAPRPADIFSPASPSEAEEGGRTPGRRRTRREQAADRAQELREARADLAALKAAGMTPEQIAIAAQDREIDDMLERGTAPEGFELPDYADEWLLKTRRNYMRAWINGRIARDPLMMDAAIRNFQRYSIDYLNANGERLRAEQERVRELQNSARPAINVNVNTAGLKGGFQQAVNSSTAWQGSMPLISEFPDAGRPWTFFNPAANASASSVPDALTRPMSISEILANTPIISLPPASGLSDQVAAVQRIVEQAQREAEEAAARNARETAREIALDLAKKAAEMGLEAYPPTAAGADPIERLVAGIQALYEKAPALDRTRRIPDASDVPPEAPEVLVDDDEDDT